MILATLYERYSLMAKDKSVTTITYAVQDNHAFNNNENIELTKKAQDIEGEKGMKTCESWSASPVRIASWQRARLMLWQ